MYELGEDAGSMRAAICCAWHSFGQIYRLPAKNPFPKATRVLRGFSRLVPSKARDPFALAGPRALLRLLAFSRGTSSGLPRFSCSLTLMLVLVKPWRSRRVMFCLQCVTLASPIGLQFVRSPSSALQIWLALGGGSAANTTCSGVPLPMTLFSAAYSCQRSGTRVSRWQHFSGSSATSCSASLGSPRRTF